MSIQTVQTQMLVNQIKSDLHAAFANAENTEINRAEIVEAICNQTLKKARPFPAFEVDEPYTVTDFHLRDTRRGVQVVLCQDGVEKEFIQLRGRRTARKIGKSRVDENNLIMSFTVWPPAYARTIRIEETIKSE